MGADADAYGPCGCHLGAWWGVTPPPRCMAHGGPPPAMTTEGTSLPVNVIDYGQYELTKNGSPTVAIVATLTDQDVERIARRVAEMLMAMPLPVGRPR